MGSKDLTHPCQVLEQAHLFEFLEQHERAAMCPRPSPRYLSLFHSVESPDL